MEDKLTIDDIRKQKIFYICSTLVKGKSAPKLAESLKTFITDIIKEKDAAFFKQIIREHHIPSESSLKRLLYEGERAYLMLAHHPYLEKILSMYIDHYQERLPAASTEKTGLSPSSGQESFSPAVIDEIADNASNVCSAPGCLHFTSGASFGNTGKPLQLGVACLLQGVQEGDPRYDANAKVQPKSDDAENGIWLCVYHAQLVNGKQNGYTAAKLREWKEAHVATMNAVIEGRKRIYIAMQQHNDRKAPVATALLNFFNEQAVLFTPADTLSKENAITGIRTIQTYLRDVNTGYGTLLQQENCAMEAACSVFNEAADGQSGARVEYKLAALQKAIGWCLYTIAAFYELELPGNVNTIVPQYTSVNEQAV